ncbi:MAG: hypothetical protein HY698_10545 [Deltaproteobacteria bacterium]|nr:hypothetical protein [Deltaproteobacteria bacterium]
MLAESDEIPGRNGTNGKPTQGIGNDVRPLVIESTLGGQSGNKGENSVEKSLEEFIARANSTLSDVDGWDLGNEVVTKQQPVSLAVSSSAPVPTPVPIQDTAPMMTEPDAQVPASRGTVTAGKGFWKMGLAFGGGAVLALAIYQLLGSNPGAKPSSEPLGTPSAEHVAVPPAQAPQPLVEKTQGSSVTSPSPASSAPVITRVEPSEQAQAVQVQAEASLPEKPVVRPLKDPAPGKRSSTPTEPPPERREVAAKPPVARPVVAKPVAPKPVVSKPMAPKPAVAKPSPAPAKPSKPAKPKGQIVDPFGM